MVAYVGVMGLQDGLDYLVDAAHLMKSPSGQCQDIQFVLVGSGPELTRLENAFATCESMTRSCSPGGSRRKMEAQCSHRRTSASIPTRQIE